MGKRLTPSIITTGFLATTSALALLGGGEAIAAPLCETVVPGNVVADFGTLCPAVSNSGSILSVQISNSGAIGATLQTTHFVNAGSTFHSSIVNTGTIAQIPFINAVNVQSSTLIGSIVNTGTIFSSLVGGGIIINNSAVNTGGADAVAILNTGSIVGGPFQRPGIGVVASTLTGAIVNGGTISGGASGIMVSSPSSLSASVTNSGVISISANPAAPSNATGIVVTGLNATGTIVNAGTINITQGNAIGRATGLAVRAASFGGTIANGDRSTSPRELRTGRPRVSFWIPRR